MGCEPPKEQAPSSQDFNLLTWANNSKDMSETDCNLAAAKMTEKAIKFYDKDNDGKLDSKEATPLVK